jgi:hypothetical protein
MTGSEKGTDLVPELDVHLLRNLSNETIQRVRTTVDYGKGGEAARTAGVADTARKE